MPELQCGRRRRPFTRSCREFRRALNNAPRLSIKYLRWRWCVSWANIPLEIPPWPLRGVFELSPCDHHGVSVRKVPLGDAAVLIEMERLRDPVIGFAAGAGSYAGPGPHPDSPGPHRYRCWVPPHPSRRRAFPYAGDGQIGWQAYWPAVHPASQLVPVTLTQTQPSGHEGLLGEQLSHPMNVTQSTQTVVFSTEVMQ